MRAQDSSYREIADVFGTDEHTVYNHTHDVKVEAKRDRENTSRESGPNTSTTSQRSSSSAGSGEEKVRVNIPVEIAPKTLMALYTAASAAGYDNADDYYEAITQARRAEELNRAYVASESTRTYAEPSETQVVKQEPWTFDRGMRDLQRAWLGGAELRMFRAAVNGRETRIDPPAGLFPEYDSQKREKEARLAAEERKQSLLTFVENACKLGWTIEYTVKILTQGGMTMQELETIVVPKMKLLPGFRSSGPPGRGQNSYTA